MQRFYGDFEVVVFKDGISVDKNAEDYRIEKKRCK